MLKYLRDLLESGSVFKVQLGTGEPCEVLALDEFGIVLRERVGSATCVPWAQCSRLIVQINEDTRRSSVRSEATFALELARFFIDGENTEAEYVRARVCGAISLLDGGSPLNSRLPS